MDETTEQPSETKAISEEQRRKISEGMKRAHARRKKLKEGQEKAPIEGLLGRLRAERDELDLVIKALEKRGL